MTATQPVCQPTTVLAGDQLCLEGECDHERTAEGGADGLEEAYCDEVREETVCGTHSTFAQGDFDFEELVAAAPWPCTKDAVR